MPIEHKVRSAGTKALTYPWMRRYLTFVLVRGSVRHTLADKAATNATVRMIDAAAARRRRSKTDKSSSS